MQNQEYDTDAAQQENDDSETVNIEPSEPNDGSSNQNEENAPGRTPGKAEGIRETVEADLAENENR